MEIPQVLLFGCIPLLPSWWLESIRNDTYSFHYGTKKKKVKPGKRIREDESSDSEIEPIESVKKSVQGAWPRFLVVDGADSLVPLPFCYFYRTFLQTFPLLNVWALENSSSSQPQHASSVRLSEYCSVFSDDLNAILAARSSLFGAEHF